MRNLILSIHTSLDGFVSGSKGEIDWVKLDEDMFDFVARLTDDADTALYGRITYQMMENYWPTAAEKPHATKHDIQHSEWYNKVKKVILSRSLHNNGTDKNTVIKDKLYDNITALKNQPGKNILIFGSPTAAHSLMELNLIDEYWLFVNPVLLGKGTRLFARLNNIIDLIPIETKIYPCGVTCLGYKVNINPDDFPMTG
jgi:dihydrofolate reductase